MMKFQEKVGLHVYWHELFDVQTCYFPFTPVSCQSVAVVVVAFVLRVERGVASVVAAMLRLGADRLRARAPILCDTSTLNRRQA